MRQQRLGVTADALDQYDQMRAIERCDELVQQLRSLQLLHSQNLCRVANHLASEAYCWQRGIDPADESESAVSALLTR